jgi:hypothetical protein
MTESEYTKLCEVAWRRQLTGEEKARLQSYLLVHPEAHDDLDEQIALSKLLSNLSDSPISSNFTARVLQSIDFENVDPTERSHPFRTWLVRLRLWLPRFALAGLVVGLGGLGFQQHRLYSLREKATSVEIVSKVATTLPDVQMWEDFDAISKLGQTAVPSSQDEILWAALGAISATEQQ